MFQSDRLELKCSVTLALVLAVTHLAAMLIAAVFVEPLLLQLALLLLLCTQLGYLVRRHLWLSHPLSIISVRWDQQHWYLQLADGRELQAAPTTACRLYPRVALLQFKALKPQSWRDRIFNLWLFADSGSACAIRRMRVQLNLADSSQS